MNGGSDSMCRLGQFPTAGDNAPSRVNDCRKVGDVNRQLRTQSHRVVILAMLDELLDFLPAPSFIHVQQDFRQLQWMSNTHSAMAECPSLPFEQALRRRVMEVDGMLVREEKFHLP